MSGEFSSRTLTWMNDHRIDPKRAASLGVSENGRGLEFPNGRVRLPGGPKTLQPKGQPLESWRLCGDPSSSVGLVCEGEGDALAAATHLPHAPTGTGLDSMLVFAIPGTAYPVDRLVGDLSEAGVSQALLALDADEAGLRYSEKAVSALRAAGIQPAPVELPEGCDLADCLAGADDPVDWLANALVDAGCAAEPLVDSTPPDEHATVQQSPEETRADAWKHCESLAHDPCILDRLSVALCDVGLVGEDRAAKLIYLALTSRLLARPVSVAVKGPSAGGKSYIVETVLGFFPGEAFYTMTGMSERALAYSEEPLSHRVLVIFEAAGMTGEFATYLLRSLLSEGCVRYETVEKTSAGIKARLIEREGPTGLVVTTTQVKLHPENETRLLSIPVTDSPEQTQAVMLALADDEPTAPDVLDWLSLQEWIAAGDCEVAVPFAKALARLIPPAAVRLRRDFSAVLGLVRAHALLHQASRKWDGRIIATLEDYAVVRELVHRLVSDGVDATVRPATRDTVQAIEKLAADHEGGVPQAALARELKMDRSSVSRRVNVALDGGYLRNLEDRKGRAAKLVVGDPLPTDLEILPTVTKLEGVCTVARPTGGINQATLQGAAA